MGKTIFNKTAAAEYLRKHASPTSQGMCAKAVRLAIAAGGINIVPYPPIAKTYGSYLLHYDFAPVPEKHYKEQVGDVVVLQTYKGGNSEGHIAMYDGKSWISDFVQRDFWGGPGYRTAKPSHAFYRHD